MFDFRDKKKNELPTQSSHDQKKNSLDDIKDDLTVLERDEMNRLMGSKSVPVSFSDILTWSSSLGGPTPQ